MRKRVQKLVIFNAFYFTITFLEYVIVFLLLVIIVLFILYRSNKKKVSGLGLELKDVKFRKQSLSTKYGKMTEQFMPFLESYPYNEQNFRFIGTPIDGVQFENDKIVFIEFKTGDSRLSLRQREIRDLVNKGKIEFREFRI